MERECRIVNVVSGSTTFGVEWQEGRVVREITMWNDCGTNDFGVYSGCLEEEGEEEIKEEMAEELLSHSERHKISTPGTLITFSIYLFTKGSENTEILLAHITVSNCPASHLLNTPF